MMHGLSGVKCTMHDQEVTIANPYETVLYTSLSEKPVEMTMYKCLVKLFDCLQTSDMPCVWMIRDTVEERAWMCPQLSIAVYGCENMIRNSGNRRPLGLHVVPLFEGLIEPIFPRNRFFELKDTLECLDATKKHLEETQKKLEVLQKNMILDAQNFEKKE